jgi:TonB-dependent SusC/RagA subfamily outer membrane receptor
MRKQITLIALALAFLCTQASAQDRTISGKVTSSQDNLGIPGVSVVVVGTTTGTSTDIEGNYKLTVSNEAKQLQFSGVGLATQVLDVGTSDQINVSMRPDVKTLNTVVVTALGISREKKSLGYATQQISGDQVTDVKSGNFVNQLSGKVAGVQVRNEGNMGGSTNIIIRGTTSLLGDNQALFIVDGVAMDNSLSNDASQPGSTKLQNRGTAGYDFGSPISDINPDDIESINVLKGAASTALYGSRAARGVILITTKKGKLASATQKKRFGVSYNFNATRGYIDKKTFPTYQNEYGAGYGRYYGGPNGEPSLGDHFFIEDVNGNGILDTNASGQYLEQVTPYTEDASYGEHFDPNLSIYQWDAFVPGSPNYHKATPWVGYATDKDKGPLSFSIPTNHIQTVFPWMVGQRKDLSELR